jgi:predicted nucleic acid-binding protein
VVTIGELRRGLELIRHRGDAPQARRIESWLTALISEYREHILDCSLDESQVWGCLRSPHHENALDKQIAATALTHALTLVTRNTDHFANLGLQLLNPFS